MSVYPAQDPGGPRQQVTALPAGPEVVIPAFNSEDETHAELFEWTRRAAGVARRAREESDRSRAGPKEARGAWRSAQLERHDHRAWLPLMTLVALALLGLDSWAAHFAAGALGSDQRVALLWAASFLVIVGCLGAGLAWSARRSKNVLRVIAAGLAVFASLLALLRFGFLAGTGVVAAVARACVFTVCTMMIAAGGFAATPYPEAMTIWQGRRRSRRSAGTRFELIRSWADVAAPTQLAPAGLLPERRGNMPRGQVKEISHASAVA
jgi:hypothetical protein